MIRIAAGLAGMAFLTLAAISLGSSPVVFFDLPSVLMVFGIVGFGTLVSFPSSQVLAAPVPLEELIRIWKFAARWGNIV